MKLVWHIVWKDIRRLSAPAGCWIAFIAVTAIAFTQAGLPEDAVQGSIAGQWVNGLEGFAVVIVVLQHIAGVLLAATLMLEDSPADVTAFWPTRPISGLRLLAAKLIVAFGLLIIAPLLPLLAVWTASGFSGPEVRAAALEFSTLRIMFTVPALALAAVSGNLARFLALVLGAILLEVLTLGVADLVTPTLGSAGTSAYFMANVVAALGVILILIRQYAGARKSAWGVTAAVLIVGGIVGSTWTWDLSTYLPALRRAATTPEQPQDRGVVLQPVSIRPNEPVLEFKVRGSIAADRWYAPQQGIVRLTWPDQPAATFFLWKNAQWGDDAARQIASATPRSDAHIWQLRMNPGEESRGRTITMPPTLSGKITIAVLRGRMLCEIPLRPGAEARAGSSRVRAAGIRLAGDYQERRQIALEERAAHLVAQDDFWTSYFSGFESQPREHSVYLLRHRETGYVSSPLAAVGGAAWMHGLLVRPVTLEFELPAGAPPEWERGATLVKVSFETERTFERALPIAQVALQTVEDAR